MPYVIKRDQPPKERLIIFAASFAACIILEFSTIEVHHYVSAQQQIPPKWHECIKKGVIMAYGGGAYSVLSSVKGAFGVGETNQSAPSIADIANKSVNGSIASIEHCVMGNQTK